MASENLPGRMRQINDLGLVAMLFLVAGAVFEIVGLVRVFQEGSYFFLIFAGLALIVIGLIITRRSIAQGPRQPR